MLDGGFELAGQSNSHDSAFHGNFDK